jgi:chemotaxis signal transduction protein
MLDCSKALSISNQGTNLVLSPYDLLLGLALLHERNQQKESAICGWSGVLVQVANQKILIERESLKEIVTISKATRVIDDRDWLAGVMGYEGAIIPLIEFRTLLDKTSPLLGLKDRALLVISRQNENIGLLVDKVYGHRDYWSDDKKISDLKASKQSNKRGCSKVSFTCEGDLIEVCDPEKLAALVGIRREALITAI